MNSVGGMMTDSCKMRYFDLRCMGGDPELGPPALALFKADLVTARKIFDLAAGAAGAGQESIEPLDGRVVWYDSPGMLELYEEAVDASTLAFFKIEGFELKLAQVPALDTRLHVARDRFWFTCRRRYSADEIRTGEVPLGKIEGLLREEDTDEMAVESAA